MAPQKKTGPTFLLQEVWTYFAASDKIDFLDVLAKVEAGKLQGKVLKLKPNFKLHSDPALHTRTLLWIKFTDHSGKTLTSHL
jgi:hypothetical protein